MGLGDGVKESMESLCFIIIAEKPLKTGKEAGLPAGQASRVVNSPHEGQW